MSTLSALPSRNDGLPRGAGEKTDEPLCERGENDE